MKKIILTEEQIKEIKKLFSEGFGTRKIAEQIGVKRDVVKRFLPTIGLKKNIEYSDELTIDQKLKIDELFNLGLGSIKIAEKISSNRWRVEKHLGDRRIYRPRNKITEENTLLCHDCNQFKTLDLMIKKTENNGTIHYRSQCYECKRKINNENYKSTEDREKEKIANKKLIIEIIKLYKNGFSCRKIAKQLNTTAVIIKNRLIDLNEYIPNRKNPKRPKPLKKICKLCPERGEQDIFKFCPFMAKNGEIYRTYMCNDCARLRRSISSYVRYMLKSNNSSKNGESCSKYLPFTMQQLRDYIESLFSHPDNLGPNGEIWMNWDNHGQYIKSEWDENDCKTWKWQLDHIQPHSDFRYNNMICSDFKDCWSLSNLRPYSAKQNSIDGFTKIRHKKK